ncbi:LacI family DNA-binding transcriptional regulator [Streptomyces cellulosae]|uniref:LacI family DNA-binding transcriptional regulator n=1 Tax=Streptomyces cellulosae TaxID=1968 RepID=UPI0004C6DEF1|nr:LacI family DNA-binding transcriptional regulator [Streptomyces cellulosae]
MPDRVTIAQVAEEAGVSAMTVSNVLNGKPGAKDETRRRVMEVVDRLGYVPNVSARGLKGGRTGLVGVLTLDLTTQYGLEIVRGIADELASLEFEALINVSYHDGSRERDRIGFLTRGLVDGLLMIAPVLEDETISLLRQRGIPAVVIDPRNIDVDLPRVTVDNYHGTRSGTQHLIGLGHTRIAYIGGNLDLESTSVRFKGFDDAMRLAGLTVDEQMVAYCDFSYVSGFRTASRFIEEHRPTAIVAGADLIAFGAIDAARKHGFDVPGQLSVVGFDDLPQAAQSYPGLTTVRQPLHDMGQTAVRALMSIIEGNAPVMEHMQMPTTLVVRGTTAAPSPGQGRG